MFENFITTIKPIQEKRNEIISVLRPEIMNFQRELIEGLKTYISEAQINGIAGVEFVEEREYGNGVHEYILTMANQDIHLVINENIGRFDPQNHIIGNYSFIYLSDDDDAEPFFQISVFIDDYERTLYSIAWFPNGEKKSLIGDLKLDKDSGQTAASKIISFLYSGDYYLSDQPTLQGFRLDMTPKGKLGFL